MDATIRLVPSVQFLLHCGYAEALVKARLQEALELRVIRERYVAVLGTTDLETIYEYHKTHQGVEGP